MPMAELIRLAASNDGEEQRLPRNVEAEAAFLGALMIDNRIIEDVSIKLRPEHFFEPLHGRIFEQILRLIDRNMLVTPVTLKPLFENDETMKELGGPGYLVKLTADGAGLIGARDFAQQIYDLALLRELVSVGRGLVEGALDTSDAVDPKAQIEQAEAQLYKVAEGEGETGSMKSFLAASTEAIKNVEKALNSGGHLSGVTTGLDSINAKCGGLHNSDLIILAGRPGMGKTSLATNIAFNAAQRWLRDEEDGIPPEKASVPRPPFSASKCRPTSLQRVSLPNSRGSVPKHCAWARSAAKISANCHAQAATCNRCRSISMTPRRSPSPACAPARAPAAQAWHRPDRHRLSAATAGLLAQQRQPRQRNLRNFARPENAGKGIAGTGDRAFAA